MSNQPEQRVDLIVAKRLWGLRGLQLRGQLEIRLGIGMSHFCPHERPGGFGAGPGVADVDALADEIVDMLDAAIGTGDDRDGLGVHGKYRTQLLERTGLDEGILTGAVVGVVLPVGLGNAHVQLTGADGVDVVDRAAGGLHRAANAVLFLTLVHEPANCTTRGVINAGDATGADGYELGGTGSALTANDRPANAAEATSTFLIVIILSPR